MCPLTKVDTRDDDGEPKLRDDCGAGERGRLDKCLRDAELALAGRYRGPVLVFLSSTCTSPDGRNRQKGY
jgi:hypothetical protein